MAKNISIFVKVGDRNIKHEFKVLPNESVAFLKRKIFQKLKILPEQ